MKKMKKEKEKLNKTIRKRMKKRKKIKIEKEKLNKTIRKRMKKRKDREIKVQEKNKKEKWEKGRIEGIER